MFDAVLHAGNVPQRRLGSGALISAVAHAAVVALVLYASARPIIKELETPEVMFKVPLPPPPPPPPPGGPSVPRTETPKKPKPVRTELAIPREPVKEVKEQPPEESTEEAQPGGQEGGVPGGVPGGIPGGQVGGTGTALAPVTQPPPPPPPPTNAVIPFGAGMERPRLMAGSPPGYSKQARAASVEGTVLVKCVITTSGSLRDCRIIKGLPFLDEQVLDALASQRYTPVTFQGRPVDVEYVLTFKFKLQ
jgi:periplasmic protein TonB